MIAVPESCWQEEGREIQDMPRPVTTSCSRSSSRGIEICDILRAVIYSQVLHEDVSVVQ